MCFGTLYVKHNFAQAGHTFQHCKSNTLQLHLHQGVGHTRSHAHFSTVSTVAVIQTDFKTQSSNTHINNHREATGSWNTFQQAFHGGIQHRCFGTQTINQLINKAIEHIVVEANSQTTRQVRICVKRDVETHSQHRLIHQDLKRKVAEHMFQTSHVHNTWIWRDIQPGIIRCC